MAMTLSVGVVIPAYRPKPTQIIEYVGSIDRRLDPTAILVELDAPRNGVVDRLSESLPASASVNVSPRRRGKGAAVTAGFEALAGGAVDGAEAIDVLLFADADGSTPAASLATIVDRVTDGRADLAVGSRRHPESTVVSHQTLARRRLGDAFAWLARHTLDVGLYDYQCGAKALSSGVWTAVRDHLYEPGFAWDIELTAVASALGFRVAEVPVVWEDQPGSTVSPVRTSLRLGRGLLASRHRERLLREDRLHSLIEARRSEPALVDRLRAEVADGD